MGNSGEENGDFKKRNGRKMTKHHLVPRSRGGGEIEKNIVKIPDRYHVAFHTFFGNSTPREAIAIIRRIFINREKGDRWKPKDIYLLQLEIQAETIRKEREKEKKE